MITVRTVRNALGDAYDAAVKLQEAAPNDLDVAELVNFLDILSARPILLFTPAIDKEVARLLALIGEERSALLILLIYPERQPVPA